MDEFLHRSAETHQGKINIIHSSFDPVDIHVSDDRAISEAFCLVTSSVTINGIDYELASHMRLFSRLRKLPDINEWRLLSLESSYVRDRLVPAFPAVGGGAALPQIAEVQTHPKGYRSLALVMMQRGLRPRSDLPHEDLPESVKRIKDHNRAYLEGGTREQGDETTSLPN